VFHEISELLIAQVNKLKVKMYKYLLVRSVVDHQSQSSISDSILLSIKQKNKNNNKNKKTKTK
jgi:hypothetical protein